MTRTAGVKEISILKFEFNKMLLQVIVSDFLFGCYSAREVFGVVARVFLVVAKFLISELNQKSHYHILVSRYKGLWSYFASFIQQ